MIIRANRVQFIWSPLLGWALLTGTVSDALAQITITPPGGVTAPSTAPDNTVGGGAQGPAGGQATGGTAVGGAATGPADATVAPPPTTPNVPPPSLPPGTTVQNPSTQLVPGTSDLISGITPSTGGGSAPGGELIGFTLGSFRLYPQIDLSAGYDTNVFAQNTATGAPVASLYSTIQPSLVLRSEWLNHSLNFLLSGGFGFYQSAPTQNYQNYILMADGRIDVREDTYVTWSGGYKRTTEALGSPNVAFAQAPTVDEAFPVTLAISHRLNRITVDAGGSAAKYTYTDYSTITSQGLSAENRNRMEYEEYLRFGYELSDNLTLYVRPAVNQIRYDLSVDTLGQDRNADTLSVSGGALVSLGPTSKLEGSLGFTSQSGQTGQSATSAMTFGLSGSWNGYEPLTIRPTILRSINQSALTNYLNYVNTTYGLEFNYALHSDWSAVGGASLTTADYTPVPGLVGVPARTDYFFRGSLGLLYSLRPQVQIGPVFEYTQSTSTDPINGQFFTRELFSIRLIARR